MTSAVILQDILIEDGKIVLIERGLEAEADQVIDASGLAVSPGLVDMHVHLRDPGLTYKEDIITGSNAAARWRHHRHGCQWPTPAPRMDCPEQVQ